jgi:hypothetical protein
MTEDRGYRQRMAWDDPTDTPHATCVGRALFWSIGKGASADRCQRGPSRQWVCSRTCPATPPCEAGGWDPASKVRGAGQARPGWVRGTSVHAGSSVGSDAYSPHSDTDRGGRPAATIPTDSDAETAELPRSDTLGTVAWPHTYLYSVSGPSSAMHGLPLSY